MQDVGSPPYAPFAPEDVAEFQFEPCVAFWNAHRDSRGAHECVAEKLCLSKAQDAALVTVVPQFEHLLDKFDCVFSNRLDITT